MGDIYNDRGYRIGSITKDYKIFNDSGDYIGSIWDNGYICTDRGDYLGQIWENGKIYMNGSYTGSIDDSGYFKDDRGNDICHVYGWKNPLKKQISPSTNDNTIRKPQPPQPPQPPRPPRPPIPPSEPPIGLIIIGALTIPILFLSGADLIDILLQSELIQLYAIGAIIVSWISFLGKSTLEVTIITAIIPVFILFEYISISDGLSEYITLEWIFVKFFAIIILGILSVPFGAVIGVISYGLASAYRFLHEKKYLRWLFIAFGISLAFLFMKYQRNFRTTIEMIESGEYEEASQDMNEPSFFKIIRGILDDDKEIAYTNAKKLIENGEFEEAGELLYDIQQYKNCTDLIDQYNIKNTNRFVYEDALLLYENEDYLNALEAFYNLDNYRDSMILTRNCAFYYLQGTWVNEEIERFIKISKSSKRSQHIFNGIFFYGGTDIMAQLTGPGTKYSIESYEFGYDENDSIAFDFEIKKEDGTETTIQVRDLCEATCTIVGEGSFSRTHKHYNSY